MKRTILALLIVASGCIGTMGGVSEEQTCHRDFECVEYPVWQTWETAREGWSDYECEPCWWGHHRQQRGDCCSCNSDVSDWCSGGDEGVYHCTPLGEFEYESCASWCQRVENLPYGGTCENGNCVCLN